MYSLILLLSELLPLLVFILSPLIDGTQRQMMCKFEETLINTFRAKYLFFLGTAVHKSYRSHFDVYSLMLFSSELLA